MTLTPYKIDLSMYEGEVRRVVSEAVQKKAWSLGYPGWFQDGQVPKHTNREWLYFEDGNGASYATQDLDDIDDDCELISAASFLSLPEPTNADNR